MSILNISLDKIWQQFNRPTLKKYQIFKLLAVVVAIAVVVIIFFTIYFVYKNIYNSLNNVYAILNINSKLGVDNVDMNNYYKVSKIIAQKKKNITIPSDLKNVFDYNTAPANLKSPLNPSPSGQRR